jgi:transmembrane sensor
MKNMEEQFDLAKWLAGEMSENELEAFEKSPQYAAYAKIKKYSGELEAPAINEEQLYSNIIENKKTAPKVVSLYRTWLSIAAAVVILVGLLYFYQSDTPAVYHAENGRQTSFALPDDSQVVLNAGSEIDYSKKNWDDNRKLHLDGEAYFRVAKGKKFEVTTKLGKVTVLGTQFNVKARKDRFDISCYEGRVKVNYQHTEVIITKGMAVAFANGTAIEIPQLQDAAPEWLHNKLVFTKESLSSIVDELNRQYPVGITLRGNNSEQLFTGVLPMKNLNEDLQILSSIYHLNVIKTEGKIILETVDAN